MEGNINKDIHKNSKPKQEVVQKLEVLEKNVENENNENNNESENNNSKEPEKLILKIFGPKELLLKFRETFLGPEEISLEGMDTIPKIINIEPKWFIKI